MLILWNPNKHSGHRDSKELGGGWTHWCAGIVMHWLLWERAWKLSGTLPDLPFLLWLFLIWLFLSCLLYNKIIIISIALSWIMWVIRVHYWNWGGPGKSWIYNRSAEVWEALKTWGWHLQRGETRGDLSLTPVEADTEGSARIVRSIILQLETTHFW